MGTYLNNMPDGKAISRAEKYAQQKRCKFTLCFESTSYQDFCTEKIVDAFVADTIPIYYGDPHIGNLFNTQAFINCADYSSYEEILHRIKELDENDEEYIRVMRQPIYIKPEMVSVHYEELKMFLYNIFDQPLDAVYRRSRVYLPKAYNDMLFQVFRTKRKKCTLQTIKSKLARMLNPIYCKYKQYQRIKAQKKEI